MWIYPTYNRPKQCRAVLGQIANVGCTTPGIVVVQGTDMEEEYKKALGYAWGVEDCISGWTHIFLPENIGICGALNFVYSLFPNEPFYGVITDDEFVFTSDWDQTLVKAAGDWNVAHGNNHWQSENRCHGYMTLGGELVREVGYIMPPDLWHWYSDNVWEYIASQCDLRKFCRDVLMEDRHYLSGKSLFDDTYKMGESRKEQDAEIFHEWLQNSGPLIERIRAKLPKKCFNFKTGTEQEK